MQPVFAAMSDRMRTSSLLCGRRRIFIIVAQVSTVATLAAMALAPLTHGSYQSRFWLLAWAYGAFQVANCMFCAPMGAVLPELVPVHQQGSSGGWAAFWGGISTLIGSFLGIAVGSTAGWASWVNMTSVYVILSVVNLLGLWLGVLAFSAKPGCCELEAAPPPLDRDDQPGSSTNLLVKPKKRGGCSELTAFLDPYKHRPFMAMFWFNMLQGVGGIVSVYFTQYYMKDVVMASTHGFKGLCGTAEAATSLFGLVQSIAFMATSLAGGYKSRF